MSGVDNARCHHEFPIVNGIRTHVIKYGKLSNDTTALKQKLVVVIPGNPGAVDFYQTFMATVHQESGWPVWGLSHAGHSTIPSHVQWQKPDNQIFTLEGQIQHKIYFLNEYVPENVEILLIGHSIGAYVVLKVMSSLEEHRVIKGMLLFPTIERMATSPRGMRLTPVLKYARWLLVFISCLLFLLPNIWQKKLVCWLISKRPMKTSIPECINSGILHMFNPYCVMNALYMAHVEMHKVDALEEHLVAKLLPKLHFYYGATDHWCPVSYYNDMKNRFPNHPDIYLCNSGFRHAFIIDASEPMGKKVSGWLNDLS